MKKIFYLIAAISLATAVLAACSGNPEVTATSEPSATPTVVPTATPTAVPTSVSTPDPAASIRPDAEVSGGGTLSVECPTDGTLGSAAAVSSCSALAVQQVKSFSFNAEIALLALFPVEEAGGGEGSMRLSGSMVQPDRLRFQINLGPDAEMVEISGVIIGSDTYIQDPESRLWFKGTPPDDDLLTSLQLVGMLMLPTNPAVSLNGTIDLDDGSMAYLIVSDQPAQGSGAGFPLGSGGRVTSVVGVADFLIREVKVAAEGLDGETRDFIIISYHGYNEAAEIEPPADYLPLPDEAMDTTVIPEHTATPTGTAMPTPEPTPTTAPASPSPTQIPGRADLYRVVQPPEHMAYIWWQWELHEFRELMIDFTIHNDPGNFSDRHGLYLMLCYSSISDQGFYLGLQTDASDPDLQRGRGKALIFSRWGTRNLSNARVADRAEGWSESSDHEGDFIGVRRNYDWGAGSYRMRIAPDGAEDDGAWFGVWITDLSADLTTWIGSLKFPLVNDTATIRAQTYTTVEIYGSPIRQIDIPEWHVSVERPAGDGVKSSWGDTGYSPFESEILNADVRYDPADDAVHFYVGAATERATRPQTMGFE